MKKSLLLMLIAGATLAFAGSKIAPDVPGSSPTAPSIPASKKSAPIDVIVRFKTTPTKNMLKQLGPYGQVKKTLDVIHAVHVALQLQDILALQNDPDVLYVSPDRPLQAKLDVTTQTVNANIAWNLGWDGTGVGVSHDAGGQQPGLHGHQNPGH